jgi:putative ABC transport system permease protein
LSLLAFRLAWRDLRGGIRGMRIVLACLALGVAAIASVGTLRASMDRGLATEGRRLLGGDVEVESGSTPLPDGLGAWLALQRDHVSRIVLLQSLLVAPSGERVLVQVKAVDWAYPLVGEAVLSPAVSLQAALAGGLVADPLILQRLGLHVGDEVRLGEARFRLAAALESEPDRAGGAAILGPRAMIALSRLEETRLIQPGSLVTYAWRVVLPASDTPAAFRARLERAFPDTGWRVRDRRQADQGMQQAIDQTSLFLVLVGLCALLVGGIGVATGVRAWLESRARSIAIMRCVGGSARLIFGVFLIQVIGLCLCGIVIGTALGAALPALALVVFGDALPVPTKLGVYPGPLALAAAYGILTAGTFALWPLGRASRIPGAALFRDAFVAVGRTGTGVLLANAAIGILLIAAIVGFSADRWFALGFCASALATLLVFYVGARTVMALARLAPGGGPAWLRLGVSNLYRPASATSLLIVALGLGLTTLVSVALIERNIRAQLSGTLPVDAPTFFFIDIQNDQLARFASIVRSESGATDLHQVPSLRARIVALNGVPVDRAKILPDSKWAVRGDRGLTYAATIPEGSHVVSGTWWPSDYAGPPLISLDDGLAHGWGLKVGDSLLANVLGRNIEFKIANLRKIDWRALNINFTLVASPGLLEHAPHMHIATVRTVASADAPLLRAVNDALPNVTGIRVADVLAAVADLVGKLAAALAAAGSITLLSGALVLTGAIAAGQRRRIGEAVVLKTLGGTRGQIRAAWLVEFGIIGAAAGLIAAGLGTLASWAVMLFVMHAPWMFMPGTLAVTVGGCMVLMLSCGYAGTEGALRARVAPLLRGV